MRITVLFIALIMLCNARIHAQQKAKVYDSVESYLHNNPSVIDVKLSRADVDDSSAFAIQEYIITNHEDKKIYKRIRKSWLIECDSNKYIHSGKLLNNDLAFSRVLYATHDYLYFRGTYGDAMGIRKPTKRGVMVVPLGAPALVAAAVMTTTAVATTAAMKSDPPKSLSARYFDYIYDLHTKQVQYFNRGIMRIYLDDAINKRDTASAIFLTNLIKRNEQEEEWRNQQKVEE